MPEGPGLDDATRRELLAALAGEGEARFDEPMRRHTTLRIGGPADAYVLPKTLGALERVRRVCSRLALPSRAFGSGSNLLVRDGGVRGVALSLRHLARADRVEAEDGANIYVEAGASTGKLLALATQEELGGVEFLGGVPGTVGGGLIMNAGTYLGEFTNVTTQVFSVDEEGRTIARSHAECGFAYRTSQIPPGEIVTHARLKLTARARADIQADVESLRARRRDREPHGVPNAGSIFKNPPGDYAGRLIEACGLKGRRVGGAEVSPVHANWLVNAAGARAADMLALIDLVRAAVADKHGITLELEVKVVGEDGHEMAR